MNAAVFLDRDNTLIHNDGDLGDPDKVRLIKGAASAVASLQGLGYKVVVVTNQGGVARGKYTEEDVDAVHRRVNELIQANSGAFIDRFYYCPYHPEGSERRYRRDHPWRKPKPGMLIQAGKHLSLAMGQSWMVGDQMRDIQAGYAAGVTPILIDPTGEIASKVKAMPPSLNGANGMNGDEPQGVEPVTIEPNRDYFVARTLIEAARIIGQKRRPPSSIKTPTERKPSRVVVEEERVPLAESPEKKKIVKKKILRRRKKKDDKAGNIATVEPVTEAKTQPVAESKSESQPTTGQRGESPGRPNRIENNSPAGPSDGDIDLEGDDDSVHAPTLTMPSLSPDVDLDDPDDNDNDNDDSHVDVVAESNGRAARPTQQTATRPAAKSQPPPPKAERQAELQAKAPTPTKPSSPSRNDAKRSSTEQVERDSKMTPTPISTSVSTSGNTATSDGATKASDEPFIPAANGNVDQTLRQILQELRNQRLTGHEISYIGIMAIVLQVVAIVCLLAALLMGSGNDQIFSRWIACAVVLQLGTIAMLLFKK